jgi:ABC-type nitrate/sulfonate/bicarbonate transport system substrate-binding protein
MKDLPRHDLNIIFRAGHSTVWELAEKSGILAELGLGIASLEETNYPGPADEALFAGRVDFISGNHISPYVNMARGLPVVCIASPGNYIRDRVVSRQPIESLADFKDKGLHIADSNFTNPFGGINHGRANHVIDVYQAGFAPGEAHWIELGPQEDSNVAPAIIDAVRTGKADVGFVGRRNVEELEREGLRVSNLPTIPMVNGSTITTSYEALARSERLGERLVRALVLTIHYARVHPEEAQRLLSAKLGKPYREYGGRLQSITRYRSKPYPDTDGVANAYELCTMKFEEARAVKPMALWDMHYLRELDQSGFIDELIQEEPEDVRDTGGEPRVFW